MQNYRQCIPTSINVNVRFFCLQIQTTYFKYEVFLLYPVHSLQQAIYIYIFFFFLSWTVTSKTKVFEKKCDIVRCKIYLYTICVNVTALKLKQQFIGFSFGAHLSKYSIHNCSVLIYIFFICRDSSWWWSIVLIEKVALTILSKSQTRK